MKCNAFSPPSGTAAASSKHIFSGLATIVLLAGIRDKLRYADVPEGLEGTGITFIVMGLMALSFMGLSGIYAA